jgi:hypothetical protein
MTGMSDSRRQEQDMQDMDTRPFLGADGCVDAVNAGICHIADELVAKGADPRTALNAALDHVLTRMRTDRPDLFGWYVRALDTVTAPESQR